MLGDCWTHSWYNKTDGKNLTSPQDDQKREQMTSVQTLEIKAEITKWLKKDILI